jgi:hypothetical protein
MNLKAYRRKRSWPNLRYYVRIWLEGLRTTKKHLSQDSQSPGRDMNPGPPEYEATARCSLQPSSATVCSETIQWCSHPRTWVRKASRENWTVVGRKRLKSAMDHCLWEAESRSASQETEISFPRSQQPLDPILSQMNPSHTPHPIPLRLILIPSPHLNHRGVPKRFLPFHFPTTILYALLICPLSATRPAQLIQCIRGSLVTNSHFIESKRRAGQQHPSSSLANQSVTAYRTNYILFQ